MDVLRAQPPAKAPWARCLLRRESPATFYAEIKTEYAQDEEVRQRRRVIFNDMVQAVKQLQGGVSFEQSKKNWLLKGGVTAAKDFIASLRALEFTFSEPEVHMFLHKRRMEDSVFSNDDAFNSFDEEAELDKLLSGGILDEIEKREGISVEAGDAQEALQIDLPESHGDGISPPQPQLNETQVQPVNSAGLCPGLSVKIWGLTSHPELNGSLGTLDKRDDQCESPVRWLVTVNGQQYSLAEDKLQPGHPELLAGAASASTPHGPPGSDQLVETPSQSERSGDTGQVWRNRIETTHEIFE